MSLPASYRSAGDVEAAMRKLGAAELGASVDGAPILGASFGDAAATRVSFVIAGLHAIEWIGVETALALAAQLGANPPRDRRIHVVALANPDGYRRIEADLHANRRRFRRTNANGVDLNRNWPAAFRAVPPWVRRLASWNWPGAHAASEPEVAAVLRLLDREVAHGATIDTALSLHSFGRKLLIPYGGRWRRPARYAELHARASAVQDRLRDRYTIDQVSRWLPGAFAHGIEIDDLHERYGACALLVECRGGLALGTVRKGPFFWFNPPDSRLVAHEVARAVEPFVRGS